MSGHDRSVFDGVSVDLLEKTFPVRFAVLRETTSEIAQQLKLLPGEFALVRPDLHHAGAIAATQIKIVLEIIFR